MAAVKETETFQHYQVLRRPDGTLFELGRGAMGVTYKAFDTNLRCDVALKVINALNLESETARARFLREARAAAGLRHRNVASVYHLGNDDQCFFYAMEWVDGLTVEAMVKEYGAGFPVVDSLQIAAQVARALNAAFRQGLIHRDIKPANIMVAREDDDDDQLIVKVIDFGLARAAVGGEGSANITMGGFVGTPQYASPEQLEEKDLDIRSDIYSLGVTLWYMLAGRPPFTGALGNVFVQQMTKEPPWEQLAHSPAEVRALLAHMLQKNPAQRPQTPTELRREIEATLKLLPPDAAHVHLLNLPRSHSASDHGSDDSRTRPTPGQGGDSSQDGHGPGRAFAVGPGSRLAGRYELVAVAGEGSNGRVFRARDLAGDLPVAVKVLPAGVLSLPAERQRVQATIDKLREAPHPSLKQVLVLAETEDCRFLVEEWVHGFPLVDVLRSRGQLTVPEALRLLEQVASATDHAQANQLNQLELGLHQISVGLAVPPAGMEEPADTTLLARGIESWPAFSLKLDALGIGREPGDSVTWTGDMTLLPQRGSLGRDTQTSIRGFVESTYLFSLGAFVHELLSGAPPPLLPAGAGSDVRYVALPELNEAANSVLRRTLSPNPAFTTGTEFWHALCVSCNVVLPAAASPIVLPAETLALRVNAGERETPAGIRSAVETVGGVAEARADEQRALAEERVAAEKRVAVEARVAAEERAAEAGRLAAEKRAAEEARMAAEKRTAEEARMAAEKRAAEEARVSAERRAAEEARMATEKRAAAEAAETERRRTTAGAGAIAAEAQAASAFATATSAPGHESRRPGLPKIALGVGVGAAMAGGLLALLWLRAPGSQTGHRVAEHPLPVAHTSSGSLDASPPATAAAAPIQNAQPVTAAFTSNPSPTASVDPSAIGGNTATPAPANVSRPSPAAGQTAGGGLADLPAASPASPNSGLPEETQAPPFGASSPSPVAAGGPVNTPAPGEPAFKGIDALAAQAVQTPLVATPLATPSPKTANVSPAEAARRKASLKHDPASAVAHGTPPPARKKDKAQLRDDPKAKHKSAPTPASHTPPPSDDLPGFMR